jgi:hypothetical protein
MQVRVKVVNGRIGRVKTECSEDDLPLDPDFAAALKDWKTQCPESVGGWVFPSPITDRCYHASPIQQDYIRPAGKKLGWKAWVGIPFATPNAHGSTQREHRSESSRS